jgi:sodium-independent sulfate anion transporter 11
VQALIDLRDQFDRYATPNHVDWHFAGVTNRWTKRALVAVGFGYPRRLDADESSGGKSSHFVILADAESGLATLDAHVSNKARSDNTANTASLDEVQQGSTTPSLGQGDVVPLYGVNRPFFHIDLTAAVDSAVARAQ